MGPFADAEVVALAILTPVSAQRVTATAPSWEPPLTLVQRVGGSDDRITDYPQLQVTCFGADRPTSWAMAEQARQLILDAGGREFAGALVDSTSTVTPAVQIDDPRTDVRAVTATYQLAMRRPRQSA